MFRGEKIDGIAADTSYSKRKLDETQQLVESLAAGQEKIIDLIESQNKVDEQQQQLLQQLAENSHSAINVVNTIAKELKNSKVDLDKAVTNFEHVISKIENKVYDEISESVKKQSAHLRSTMSNYHDTAKEVASVVGSLKRVETEAAKFVEISSHLKHADFDLSKTMKKIQDQDREKIRLMKQVKDLKTMLARERGAPQSGRRANKPSSRPTNRKPKRIQWEKAPVASQ